MRQQAGTRPSAEMADASPASIARNLTCKTCRVNCDNSDYDHQADAAIKNDHCSTPPGVSRLVFWQTTEVDLLSHNSLHQAKFQLCEGLRRWHLSIVLALHKDQHCPARKRKDQGDRQTLQQNHTRAQPLSAAAAKVLRSSAGVGAVATQIATVKATATPAATIKTVVSCEPCDRAG
jgi:hypothetical protein